LKRLLSTFIKNRNLTVQFEFKIGDTKLGDMYFLRYVSPDLNIGDMYFLHYVSPDLNIGDMYFLCYVSPDFGDMYFLYYVSSDFREYNGPTVFML